MEEKDYIIVPNFFEYRAIVIQVSKKDPIFLKDQVAKDLKTLNIEGPILFDRYLTTGDAYDRFSSCFCYLGKFDEGLLVVNKKRDIEKFKDKLRNFYNSIKERTERLYKIKI